MEIRSRTDSTACGNAIKILHSCERRFCHNFCSRSLQAEMHIKIYIPPSREYDLESTVPLAGMQSKFNIPASGDFYLFRFTVPASGDAHKKFHFPHAGIRSRIDSSACGDAIKILHSRKLRFRNYFCAPSPRAEMHIKIYIFPLREYDLESTVPLAGMQSNFYIPANGDFYNYYYFFFL